MLVKFPNNYQHQTKHIIYLLRLMGTGWPQPNPEDTRELNQISIGYYSWINKQVIPPTEQDKLQFCLQKNQALFLDEVYSYKSLMPSEKSVSWLRLSQVFPAQTYLSATDGWEFQYTNLPFSQNKFSSAMLCLKNYPTLLKTISPKVNISLSGLYRFFVYPAGGRRKEIIIDDFIPTTKGGKYFFDSPRPSDGVWMILLEKALAKLMGSYERTRSLQKNQILSELTGYPCMELYQPYHEREHCELTIQPKFNKYFKIRSTTDTPFKLILCLWFQLNTNRKVGRGENLVVQLIEEGEDPKKIEMIRLQGMGKNMVVLASPENGLIEVWNKQVMVHIYNRSEQTTTCNLVVQADGGVHLQLIYEPINIRDCREVKSIMIKSQYKSKHAELFPIVASNYKLRIIWLGHRGVFCVKNLVSAKQKFLFTILNDFRASIHFEDEPDLVQMSCDLNPNSHFLFVLNRASNQQYGVFYVLKALSDVNQ